MTAHQWLGEVAGWLTERVPPEVRRGVRLARPEDAGAAAGASLAVAEAEAGRYYWQCGMMLAVLYAVDARGLEPGSPLAGNGQLALVSVKAVFRPAGPAAVGRRDPAAAMLASSVHRTGLLQAIASARATAHEPAVLAGFRAGYDTIAAHRDGFSRLVSAARDLDADPVSVDSALRKVAGLGEVDRHDQEWVVSATLAAAAPRGGRGTATPPASVTAPPASVAAPPDRLLAAASAIADQILARGLASGSAPHLRRVNWLGLRERAGGAWDVLPMGADLAHGYLGVALYLAQLADLTGIGRFAEVARQALQDAGPFLAELSGQPERLAATGCGGYHGLGGVSYGLARATTLLRDDQLGEWATTAARLAATAASSPAAPSGWADGLAGCLAAMTAVWEENGSPDAATVSQVTARRLAELVDRTDGWCVPGGERPLAGFADGAAGIGWALARFAAAAGEPGYLAAGQRAVGRAVSLGEPGPGQADGWCTGAAGLLAARRCLAGEASTARLRADLLDLRGRPVRGDLSLGHGELGLAEALSVVALTTRPGIAPGWLRQRAGFVLGTLRRSARYCGTPGGVPTPGLLNGLAGVGYGLLRLGFPDRVPPVLLLEPSPLTAIK
jgi:lantibiotic modifying enzyme